MERLPLPAPDSTSPAPASLEAHQRAPTLLVSANGVDRGAVTVWASDRWRLALPVLRGWGVGTVLFACWMVAREATALVPYWPAWIIAVVFLLLASLLHLRRPSYLSTDNATLAYSGPLGRGSVAWTDIQSVERRLDPVSLSPYLTLDGVRRVQIHLGGFSRAAQHRLLNHVIRKAGLASHPLYPSLFVKAHGVARDNVLPGSSSAMLSGGESEAHLGHEVTVRQELAPADSLLVWTTSPIRRTLPLLCALGCVGVGGLVHRGALTDTLGVALLVPIAALAYSWRTFRRPRFLTANRDGLGVMTGVGWVLLKWGDITSVVENANRRALGYHTLHIRGAIRVLIHLSLYDHHSQQSIRSLILEQAGLVPSPASAQVFVRPEATSPDSGGVELMPVRDVKPLPVPRSHT